MIKALLFDLDGVIIDSGDFHFKAWQSFCARFNRNITYEEFKKGFGQTNKDILNDILQKALTDEEIQHYSDEKETIFRNLAKGKIRLIPGARAFIKNMKKNKAVMGLVSSTPRANIDFILKEIQLADYFDAIISSEDVQAGKPSPECYLKAACQLHVKPEECIVFEDAIPGVQAAINAGMQCIAITTTQPAEKLPQATYIIHSWKQVLNLPFLSQ
jgi:beta-phosphoglucomutase family hydrolase